MVCCIKSVELDEDGPKHNCTCDWKGCRARYKSRGTEDGACKIICKGTMWIPYSLFAVYAKYVNTLQSICCGVKHNQGIEWLSNTLNYAYAAHFFYIATGFIMMSPMRTRIPCKAADGTNYYRASPLGLGNCTTITAATTTSAGRLLTSNEVVDQYVPLDYFDVVIWLPTYIHTWCVLSYLWCIAVTKYPIMCCFKRWVSANYFALWMVLAIMFASITLAQAIWYSNHYDVSPRVQGGWRGTCTAVDTVICNNTVVLPTNSGRFTSNSWRMI